eukprot:GHVL01011616.1.p1 GENE.GHVL01011616.1~~GHVL01011616.1.p1  ORF type:complete len:189 (+),score=24.74 GHVL01011616.1:81-647(+)
MVFKLQFLLFTLVLVLVNTHHIRKNGESLTTPDLTKWKNSLQQMSFEDRIVLFLEVWDSVSCEGRKKLFKQILKNNDLKIKRNDKALMGVAAAKSSSLGQISPNKLKSLKKELQVLGLTIDEELSEENKKMMAEFHREKNAMKEKLLKITYDSLKCNTHTNTNPKFETFNMDNILNNLLKAINNPTLA